VPPIVVSEYFNTSPAPVEEWTELLVVADTLDLRGYILTDNNQTQTQPQGGVRFRNVPLWSRLRAGTIIVINHRGSQVVDADPRDGYIEIGAQNTTYFEQVRLDSNPGLTWEDVALNVALQGDILQLLDPQGRHVHALGHRDVPGPYFDSLPPPKVHYNGACPNPGSVRVVPGLSLAAYAAGAGTDSAVALAEDVTKGLPNQSPQYRDRNQLLWRRLRQPRWNAPLLRAVLTPTGTQLEWSAADDPVPEDSLQGYIVVRDTVGQQSIPEDGRTYAVGERIGNGLVVAQTVGTVRQARDTLQFPCGARLVYRVYAFRYRTDDRLGNAPGATLARGRSYNEDAYAEAILEKPMPAAPQVRASALEICEGDSVLLWVDNPDTVAYRYQWLLNGMPLVGATAPRFVARTSGRYAVQVQTPLGCTATSAAVEVRVHPLPRVWVVVEGDTLLCPGDTVVLRATGAWRYRWYREGVELDSGAVLRATQPGRYWVVGWSEFGCWATSPVVELALRAVTLKANPAEVDFGTLAACESAREQTIQLRNAGNTALLLFRPTLPAGFAVIGQSFPVELSVGQSLTLRLRFAPPRSGVYGGAVRFPVQPCSVTVELPVRGVKQTGVASLAVADIAFGTEPLCQARSRDTLVWLYNQSSSPLSVEPFPVAPPFELVAPRAPVNVAPNDSVAIQLRYVPQLGVYQQELAVAVRAGACTDTVRAELTAAAVLPQVRLSLVRVDFPPLRGCQAVAETSLVLTNVGIVPAQVAALPVPGIQITGTPFQLQPSESRSVRVQVLPSAQGLFAADVGFLVEPCADTLRVPVQVMVEGVTAGLAGSVADFGNVVWCGRPDTAERAIDFHTNASDVQLVETVLRGDTVAFSVGWAVGERLQDGQRVYLRFHPPQPGSYWAQVEYRLRADTCIVVQQLELRGVARATEYVVEADAADFGQVFVGGQARRTLRIRNPNAFPVVLSALEGVLPPFAFEVPPRLPDTLAAGDERTYGLLYMPTQAPRRDTLWLRVRWEYPCDTASILVLAGEAVPQVQRSARLQIAVPAFLRVAPGQHVEVPVTAVSEGTGADTALRFVRLRLRYDWRLYAVQAVEGGSALRWWHLQPGELLIESEFPAGIPPSGVLARVSGEALWHPRLQTPLELGADSVVSAVPLELTLRSGILQVDSACLAGGRRLEVGAATTLWVEQGECPTVYLAFGSDEEAELRVVSTNGSVVMYWRSGGVPLRGRTVAFSLPCHQLAAGAYGIVLRQGLLWRSAWVLLLR